MGVGWLFGSLDLRSTPCQGLCESWDLNREKVPAGADTMTWEWGRSMAFQLVISPLWEELHYEGAMSWRSGQRMGGNDVDRGDIPVQVSLPEIW